MFLNKCCYLNGWYKIYVLKWVLNEIKKVENIVIYFLNLEEFFFRFIFNDFLYIIDIERSVMLLIFKYENVYFDLFLDLSIGLIEGIIFSFWNEFY